MAFTGEEDTGTKLISGKTVTKTINQFNCLRYINNNNNNNSNNNNNNNDNNIALIPLTNELNRADCGYQVHGTERKISHLLYMDDLKLLGINENDLEI